MGHTDYCSSVTVGVVLQFLRSRAEYGCPFLNRKGCPLPCQDTALLISNLLLLGLCLLVVIFQKQCEHQKSLAFEDRGFSFLLNALSFSRLFVGYSRPIGIICLSYIKVRKKSLCIKKIGEQNLQVSTLNADDLGGGIFFFRPLASGI